MNTPDSPRTAAAKDPGDSPVKISFEGLMVGWHNQLQHTYEVGILPAPGHGFEVSYIEAEGQRELSRWSRAFYEIAPTNRIWELQIQNADLTYRDPDASLFHSSKEPKRNEPPMPGTTEVNDFRWTLDLESPDFPYHTKPLPMQPGLLMPILYIKNGLLYNDEVTDIIHRKHGSGAYVSFGMISLSVSADLNVAAGDSVVLRYKDSHEEIFHVPIQANRQVTFSIRNTPPHEHDPLPNEPSHFQIFYSLFDVPFTSRSDFRRFPPVGRRPLRQSDSHAEVHQSSAAGCPVEESGAPSPYKCGIGNLGVRTSSLV